MYSVHIPKDNSDFEIWWIIDWFFFQGGLSGLAGKFPPSYMGAVVQGQALGGIFAAGSNVVRIVI